MPRHNNKKKKNNRKANNAPDPNQPRTPEQLEACLMQILSPDTEQLRFATGVIQKFLKNKNCVAPLIQQIEMSANASARQVAAVLLRAKIEKHWTKLPNEVKGTTQAVLLRRLELEKSRPVRIACAALISSVAKETVPRNQWPALLDSLLALSRSANPEHREVSMLLFRYLSETITKSLQPHFLTLLGIFQTGLSDPQRSVQDEAIKAIGVLVEMVATEEQLMAFKALVPHLIQYSQGALQRSDEDCCMIAFGVFDDLAESPTNVLQERMPQLIELMMHILAKIDMELTLREKAATFLRQIIQAKPGQITKGNFVAPLLSTAISMCIEPSDNAFGTSDLTPQNVAVEVLDAMVLNIPLRHVYPVLIETCGQLIQDPDEHKRKGAYVILAVMTEGTTDQLREQLPNLVQTACRGVSDPSPLVRAGACVALTQFADHLQPEILGYHELLVPSLINGLTSASETVLVKRKLCTGLEVFVENLGDVALQYVPTLMNVLLSMLNVNNMELQVSAINTIKSVASAAGPAFDPYAHQICTMMGQLMEQSNDEILKLRCAATECVGSVAVAMGDRFTGQYLQPFFTCAVQGMSLQSFDLREAGYNFFSKIAELLGQDFQPYMETVLTFVLATLLSDDGVAVQGREDIGSSAPAWANASDSSDSEEEALDGLDGDSDEEGGKISFSIRSGALDEKMSAMNCLSTIVEQTGVHFWRYYQKIFPALDELSEYPHPFIRSTTTTCLTELVKALSRQFPHVVQPNVAMINPQAAPILSQLMPLLLLRMVEEDEKEVCAGAAEGIAEGFNLFGIGCYNAEQFEFVKQGVQAIMEGKSPCQQDLQDIDEKEIADHDEVLLDTVTDLIAAMAKAMGPAFSPVFDILYPTMLVYCQPDHPPYDRSMSIGCFGEIVGFLGAELPKYLDTMLPVVKSGLRDQSVPVRRNAAYCTGTLFQYAGKILGSHVVEFLQLLQPLYNIGQVPDSDTLVPCKDNAVSAVAKLIITAGSTEGFPLADCTALMLSGCPLRSDMSECKYVYSCLLLLCNQHTQLMTQYVPQIVATVADVLGCDPKWVTPQLQENLLKVVLQFATQMGGAFGAVVAQLPEANRKKLMDAMR